MATTTSFTSGPWGTTDRGDLFRIRELNSDAVIATTDNGGHPVEEIFDYAQQRANATLIAASPDLYEALEFVRDTLAMYVKPDVPAMRRADRVLAQARGEQVPA